MTFGSKAGGGPGAASPAIATTQIWQASARGTLGSITQIPSPTIVVTAPVVVPPPLPPPPPAPTTTTSRFGVAAGGNILRALGFVIAVADSELADDGEDLDEE